MSLFQKKKIIVTHDSTFHADDIFAIATLFILYKGNIKVIRTRDEKLIKSADIVCDVGGEYVKTNNRFDHHQIVGAGKRSNGIPYASFGLVWDKFGEELCGSPEVAKMIDEKLVQAIDANDNGVDLSITNGPANPYFIQSAFYSFRPSWKEPQDYDSQFFKVVDIAKKILEREILKSKDSFDGEKFIYEIYQKSENKKLLIFDLKYPWEENTVKYSEPLIVVAPRPDGRWKAEAVFKKIGGMERRISFPVSWAGNRDDELVQITGVSDAIFCHNGLFMVVAKSKEGAIALANKALLA